TLTSDCIIEGVRKLPAGHSLLLERDRPGEPVSYWDLAASFRNKGEWTNEAEAAHEFNALLEDAVRLRLISDVPLGAFLSGGLDSATVVAAMCRMRPAADNHTFSIDFKEDSFS